MRRVLAALVSVACVGQEGAAHAVGATESPLSGTVDIGYRWRSNVGGSLASYRSVVDLGSGPKLLGADLTILDPAKRWFDRIELRALHWGDDPYSTAHVRARKEHLYDFTVDFRNMAYFNALPSFANPTSLLNESAFDIRRRMASAQLDLRPNSSVIPYFAFERSASNGRSVTTFVSDANEYAVPANIDDSNDTYRGGARLELRRFHATAEMGRTAFHDAQRIYEATPNAGNRAAPFLDRRLFLTDLRQSYDVRGSGLFGKALLTSNPLSWLDLFGHFLYSRPQTDTTYQQANAGNFAVSNAALFVASQQFALSSGARMPHTAGSAGAEIRPSSRIRVMASLLTDRLENTGSNSLLRNHYNQSDVDLIAEAARPLTLRGGYRYAWGDARVTVTPTAGLLTAESAKLRRQVGKGGFTYRPAARLSVSADVEAGTSSRVYFRTSLNDYRRVRLHGRYQPTATLTLAAEFALLKNENPAAGAEYKSASKSGSASILWTPASAKRMLVQGTYSRSTLRSDTTYIVPQTFARERSRYRDDAHTVDGRVDLVLPRYAGMAPRLSAGGAFFWSSGSRPTQHYQPLGSLIAPINKWMTWTSEWRYQGFGESVYGFEAFRAHLFTTGIRVGR